MNACNRKGFHVIATIKTNRLICPSGITIKINDFAEQYIRILCTDPTLDLVTIQRYYHVRWNIETGYRYFKELLGFDHYQLLSFTGIQRFWAIQFLTQNFLEFQRQEWISDGADVKLGDVVRRKREEALPQVLRGVRLSVWD